MGRIRDIAFSQIASANPIVASAIEAPIDQPSEPVLIVVEKTTRVSLAINEVCAFLGIRVEPVRDTAGIAGTFDELRPIGVLAVVDEIDCAVYDLLMAAAGFDADLPVLVITDGRPSTSAALHAAHKLWQLTDLTALTRGIETRDLIDFLFRAGRKSDTGRMMPI
jgi:hypothetical protein